MQEGRSSILRFDVPHRVLVMLVNLSSAVNLSCAHLLHVEMTLELASAESWKRYVRA